MQERRRGRPRRPTETELFLAQNEERQTKTTEALSQALEGTEDVEGGEITRTGADYITVYKPTPDGYFPRRIPATNLRMVLQNGFLPYCPHCGGQCGPGPNDCPAREKVAYRVCSIPSCNKHIYDHPPKEMAPEEKEDPNLIPDESYTATTPAQRTRAALDAHMLAFHPSEAAAMGIAGRAPQLDQREPRAPQRAE